MIRDMVPAITALRMKRDEAYSRVRKAIMHGGYAPTPPEGFHGRGMVEMIRDQDLELVSSTQIRDSDMHALLDLNADISRLS